MWKIPPITSTSNKIIQQFDNAHVVLVLKTRSERPIHGNAAGKLNTGLLIFCTHDSIALNAAIFLSLE